MKLTQEEKKQVLDIFKQVLANIESEVYGNLFFLCVLINQLPTTCKGYKKTALSYLKANKPTADLHPKFYKHRIYYKDSSEDTIWWSNNSAKAERNQRVLFMKVLIKQLSNEQ